MVPVLAIEKPLVPFLLMYGIPMLYGLMLFRILPLFQKRGKTASLTAASYQPAQTTRMPLLAAIDSSVLSGLIGIAKLGGYMVFFNLLNIVFVPVRHVSTDLLNLYQCLLEITSGIDHSGQSLYYAILILLPFGGFSCIAQTYSMISRTDLSVRTYVFHKVIQTALTALCYFIIYFH